MRILLGSHAFYPDVGGIETMSMALARAWHAGGHEVTVMTQSEGRDDLPFEVLRRPSFVATWRAARWAEVVIQNNPSLRAGWPMLLLRRPWVVSVATWISRTDGRVAWRDRVKRLSLRRARLISVSQYVADHLGLPSVVVPNCYDHETFYEMPGVTCDGDLVVVARLVSDKGVAELLQALRLLHDSGRRIRLSVVGAGPERVALEELTRELGLIDAVMFRGVLTGSALALELNRHRIMVVPSQWAEPFGVVALEGAACGCVVVGTPRGGLPEAIGPAGLVASDARSRAIADAVKRALEPRLAGEVREATPAHLARHHPTVMAEAYLAMATPAR